MGISWGGVPAWLTPEVNQPELLRRSGGQGKKGMASWCFSPSSACSVGASLLLPADGRMEKGEDVEGEEEGWVRWCVSYEETDLLKGFFSPVRDPG